MCYDDYDYEPEFDQPDEPIQKAPVGKEGGFSYKVTGIDFPGIKYISITGYDGSKIAHIPKKLNGKIVNGINITESNIEELYFDDDIDITHIFNCTYNEKLKKIYLPKSVRMIAHGAFYGCNALEEIYMPGVERIDECAFFFCASLKKVCFSDKIRVIQLDAFENCFALEDVNVEIFDEIYNKTGEIVKLQPGAFCGCKSIPEKKWDIINDYYEKNKDEKRFF